MFCVDDVFLSALIIHRVGREWWDTCVFFDFLMTLVCHVSCLHMFQTSIASLSLVTWLSD